MERLATLYAHKLRRNDTFVTRAGNAWRQLIVLAFMPWLARHRVFGAARQHQVVAAQPARAKEEEADDVEESV
jgi:hypothetical protein